MLTTIQLFLTRIDAGNPAGKLIKIGDPIGSVMQENHHYSASAHVAFQIGNSGSTSNSEPSVTTQTASISSGGGLVPNLIWVKTHDRN